MNIFWLSMDLERCAQMPTKSHISKMPTEMVQMLCTAHWTHGNDAPWMPAYHHHPCTIWVAQTVENYRIAWNLGYQLFKEFRYRRDKMHGSEPIFFAVRCAPPALTARGYTKFPQAMPDQYKHHDVITAYRDYYVGEKQHLFDWECRPVPQFVVNSRKYQTND